MLHKKIFKILSVLVAVIVAFSFFIISVSAVTEDDNGYYFSIQQPVANSNSGYIEILTSNWGPMLVYFNASFQNAFQENNVNDGSFNFYASIEDNCLVIRNQGQVSAVDGYGNSQYVNIWGFFIRPDGVTGWRASTYATNTGLAATFNINLSYPGSIIKARGYNCNCMSLGISDNNGFKPFVYGSDTALYNQMSVIEDLLRQNVAGNQAIIDNANQNASQIQSNADKNASQIQQNQDKNTDKVVNGWEQDNEIDTTVTDDYAVKDKELMDSTEQGRSSAVSVFNSFGSLFQSDGHLYKGLLAVSAVFTEFMKIDWLSSLLNFSLAIGIFAFVIGTGSQIFRSAHEDYKSDKIDKIDSSDERWLM